jgi:hypothetical protein
MGAWHPGHHHRIWTFQYDAVCDEIVRRDNTRYQLYANKTRQIHEYRRTTTFGPPHELFPLTPSAWTDDTVTIATQRRCQWHTPNNNLTSTPIPARYTFLIDQPKLVLQTATVVTVSSDGGLQYDNTTFGGVLCADEIQVFRVSGRAPSHSWPSSLTAEAYGLFYTVSQLISQLDIAADPPIRIVADNTSLLSGIQHRHRNHLYPSQCMQPEHELLQSISNLLRRFTYVTFVHVKGHQEATASFDALLNNICDSLATSARAFSPPAQHLPLLNARKATLILNGKEVSARHGDQLRAAYSSQPLRQYFKQKFAHWTNPTINDIDWFVSGKALQLLPGNTKRTIQKLIHGWLPLNAHPSLGYSSVPVLPVRSRINGSLPDMQSPSGNNVSSQHGGNIAIEINPK